MGLSWPGISFLLAARGRGASYERTLTIGRQNLFADANDIATAYEDCGLAISMAEADRLVREGQGFVEPLLRHLGARDVDSLDASSYEDSTFVHDLNSPIPDELRNRYSLVLDGGSCEHVFNFQQALKSCMEAVQLGGHLVTITPANNLLGHGFYQFSPELFYRALTPVNGFTVCALLVRATHRLASWYAVADPETVRSRVTLTSPWPSLLYVLAQRTEIVEPFSEWPQQSDYAAAWSNGSGAGLHRRRARERLPAPARRIARLAATLAGSTSGPGHFQRVEMADVARGATSR